MIEHSTSSANTLPFHYMVFILINGIQYSIANLRERARWRSNSQAAEPIPVTPIALVLLAT